jgi:hypothetical protein
MVRTLILGLSLLAAARVAAADEAAASMPVAATSMPVAAANMPVAAANMPVAAASMPVAAASAPATAPSVDATKHGAKRHAAGTKADDKAEPQAAASEAAQPGGDVKMSGMSILGNEDAPKSLVLVPWKSSQLADMPSVSRLLDGSTQPVDKDVFMRELAYYEFKSGSK